MIQQTSLMAFESIQPELTGRREQVYKAIQRLQPCYDLQISEFLGLPINCVTGRRNELAKATLIIEAGHTQSKTGSKVMLWKLP